MHAYVIAPPFLDSQRRADRGHVPAIFALRFADPFQHTYEAYALPDGDPVPADSGFVGAVSVSFLTAA